MNSDNRSSHLLGCIVGLIVAVMLIVWFFYGCDNWMFPGGWSGQDQARKKCIEEGCDGYNVIGSPSQ